MSEENNEVTIAKVEEIIQDAEIKVTPSIIDGKSLAQAFIHSRLNNATSVESAKSKAISLLLNKIDSNTRPETLVKIIEILDACTAKDMEHLASISQNDKTRDLLIGIIANTEKDKEDPSNMADSSLKALHNIFQVLKVMKNEQSKSSRSEQKD